MGLTTGRRGRCLYFVVVFYMVAASRISIGCGITTHTEIGFRALSFLPHASSGMDYKQLLLENRDAFEAGNPYPDAFYSNICFQGKFHDVSEDSHWAEFLNASISYIRTTYPMPWDDNTRKLVAFVLGFVSHQVADVSWHSLGIDQGFLAAMGYVDYHGSYDDAHSVGDPGGDVVNLFREDLSYSNPVGDWYVPVVDLVSIYQQFYQKQVVTEELITDCATILFLGRLGERLAFAKAFPKFASESPFLVDNLDGYFLGGQYDMAVWTNRIWTATIRMLEQGVGGCSIPHNPLFIRCPDVSPGLMKNTHSGGAKKLRNGFYLRPEFYGFRDNGTNAFGLSKDIVVLEHTGRGVFIRSTDKLQELLASEVLTREQGGNASAEAGSSGRLADDNQPRAASTVYPDVTLDSTVPYARLGESLLAYDLNGDGDDDLVASAPGYGQPGNPEQGAVHITYNIYNVTSEADKFGSSRTMASISDVILFGPAYEAGRFGSALAVVDLNADGIADLAVSAPTVGSANLTYTGMVSVFFGRRGLPLIPEPDVIIRCSLEYCNFGSTLAGSDLDGDGCADLVVGSPHAPGPAGMQSGLVTVFFSGASWKSGVIVNQDSADWMSYGKQAYEWYGASLYATQMVDLGAYLLVGAPNHRLCDVADCSFSPNDVQSAGAAYLYSAEESFAMVHQFLGSAPHSRLGTAMAIGRPLGTASLLALSSPAQDVVGSVGGRASTFGQAGGVDLYNLTALIMGNITSRIASYYGDRLFSRFGHQIQFADVNGDGADEMYVTAPLHTDDFSEEIHPGEEGVVVMYAGTATSAFPTGNSTLYSCGSPAPFIIPCTETIAAASFRFTVDKAHLGASMCVGRTQKRGFMATGAPHSSAGGSRLGGTVAVYSGYF